ncbi:MAG: PPC domain-containing protein, partial [Woeseiaceae bacterium]
MESSSVVNASFTGTGISAEATAPEKYSPDAELQQKLGKKAPTPNPYLSFLPAESQPDYALWRERLTEEEQLRTAGQKTTTQKTGSSLAFAAVGETEPVGTRGVNDSQDTAQHLSGFGTGDGDDAAADVSGNMKTPDAPTVFSPLPEDEGDIDKASATGLTGDGAKTASATIGDGPFGNAPITQVNISSSEDDGDITRDNVTGLDPGEFVSALADIGDGPFGSGSMTPSGDFDVYSFVVTPPQAISIDVNRQPDETVFDPIVAVADSNGTILFINDDRFPSVESSLDITFSCEGDPPCGSHTYYVFVGGYSGGITGTGSFPSDTSNSATGPGAGSEGAYELVIAMPAFTSGDFDFYSVSAVAGDRLEVEVDTSNFGGTLDPIVAIYDSAGNMLAFNDDDPSTEDLDSYISLQAPDTDTYFIAVAGFNPYVFPTSPASFLANPFDSSSGPGPGVSSEGDYDIIVSRNNADLDYYSFDLDAGDVLGVNINGGAPIIAFFAQNEGLLVASAFGDALANLPPTSPLPGGGDASMAYV